MSDWLWTAFWTFLPISELRGGLPFALAKDIPWIAAYPYCVLINTLIAPLFYLFLNTLHHFCYRWPPYARVFDAAIKRTRKKLKNKVKRYGYWGIALFVAVPLPITGAWTGTLGAWVLGLSRRRTLLAILVGVCISGLIVSAVFLFGFKTLNFFIKEL